MKIKLTKPLIIVGSVVGVIAVIILVLSLVTVSPLSKLPKYNHVSFYNLNSTSPYPYNDKSIAKIEEGLETTKFSIMHAILEGKFDYSLNLKTYKDAEDDNKKKNTEYTVAQIKAIAATDSKYMLILEYDAPVSVKVDKETITFDRVKMVIEEFNGEVGLIELVPYLIDRIDNAAEDESTSSSYYVVNPILMRGNTSKLIKALGEVKDVINEVG